MNKLDKPHKLDLHSASSAQINLDALYQIAPQCFAETRDPNTGAVARTIDFAALRQMLGDQAIDAPAYEAYQFTWVGKHDARAEAARPTDKTLRPITADSLCWDTTRNLYIEGDNLEVLKLLQKSYLGKVKMIYIDPPYNTGNDFVYRDNFAADKSEYLEAAGATDSLGNRYIKNTDTNGRYHSDWCSMIYSRLMVARTLLSDDGVIFISIDENEVHNLRKICDELFGEGNLCGMWNWFKSATPPNLSKKIKKNIEYVLAYQKGGNTENFRGAQKSSSSDDPFTKPQNSIKDLCFPAGSIHTTIKDGRYKLGVYGTDKFPNELLNDIIIKDGKNTNDVVFRNKFIWTQNKLNEELLNGTRVNLSKNLVLSYKKAEYNVEVPPNLINDKVGVDTTEKAGVALDRLFDGKRVFSYPKPVSLINYLINFLDNKDGIVVDFFSGSSTSAEAVMRSNLKYGNNCRYIMIQFPEDLDNTLKTALENEKQIIRNAISLCDTISAPHKITEIGKERIRRAGAKIKSELQEQIEKAQKEISATQAQLNAEQGKMLNDEVLKTLEEKLAQQESEMQSLQQRHDSLDTGFRVLRLDSSNFQDVYLSPKDYKQDTLAFYEDNIKAERTDLDLLFGCMLSWGVQLSLPMQSEVVEGKTIYTVNEGDLVACFAHKVSPAVIEAMADKQPLRVIFRDSCFQSDADKINIYETFKQKMDWSDQEVFKNIRVI